MNILYVAGALILLIGTIGIVLSRLWVRATKELAFVRTGLGGEQVIMNGGAVVLPIYHQTAFVNMNTLRLTVTRHKQDALITKDRMRVDVEAEFYLRVRPVEESIAMAAQTLGDKTQHPDQLKGLVEGKFVDALRAVAATMSMEQLHEQRQQFVQQVQAVAAEDLAKNGLELESVSLTKLDQTNQEFFDPGNAFDAEGLTKLTEVIQDRKRRRNEIERETEVIIKQKDLETEKQRLELDRAAEFVRLQQTQEVETRRAQQVAEVAKLQAERGREAEEAKITAKTQVDMATLVQQRTVEEERKAVDRRIKERDVENKRAIDLAELERQKQVELSKQGQLIALAEQSTLRSQAEAQAAAARAQAVLEEERVATVRELEQADRRKQVSIRQAQEEAEREATKLKVQAEAEREAALNKAEALKTEATAGAEAERIRIEVMERKYVVEAQGKRALHEAENALSEAMIAMHLREKLLEMLPHVVRESVKPMEKIEGIKIVHLDGINTAIHGGNGASPQEQSLPDGIVKSALTYRVAAPLIDSLMREAGLGSMLGPELLKQLAKEGDK